MIKYSTIIPVYNSKNTLDRAVRSIINQTYSNWELILVNDGSNDGSDKICDYYEKKDKRIKVIHKKNSGPGDSRNCGVSIATGDYISFMDSDDYYSEDYYEILNNLNKEKKYDIIFFGMIGENNTGKINNYRNIYKYNIFSREDLLKLQAMGVFPWGPCIKIVKSEIAKKCKFSNLKVGEELEFSFGILKNSKNILFIDKYIYHYIHNNNGQHTKGGKDPWNDVTRQFKEYLVNDNLYDEYKKSLNGLALHALSIAIYRNSKNYRYKVARKKIKEVIENYTLEFDINNTENQLLSKKLKILLFMINRRMYLSLYIISKIKSIL